MNIKTTMIIMALTLVSESVWSETTTAGVEAIFDRTIVNAGGTINMAVLGLTATGETDIAGELGGSEIRAIINTTICTATRNNLTLAKGKGRVSLECPTDITEETTETVSVGLQEILPNGSTKSIGITKTYEVTILPSNDNDPEKLAIMAFYPATNDPQGKIDCFLTQETCSATDDGIYGEMTAGQSGGQIIVWDANPKAKGTVTVTLTGPLDTIDFFI